jgi:hypothetical protein
MATYQFRIDSYLLTVVNKPIGMGIVREIGLEGTGNSEHYKAALRFFPGTPEPEVKIKPNGTMTATFPASDWDAIVDLLRNEKPVWFYGSESGLCNVSTSAETVGEEES